MGEIRKIAIALSLLLTLNSCSTTTVCTGKIANQQEGELANHLSPQTQWGFIDTNGQAIFPLKYKRVFCLKQPSETILVGLCDDSPAATKEQTDSVKVPIDYITYGLDGSPKHKVRHSSINLLALKLLKSGSITSPSLLEHFIFNSELLNYKMFPGAGGIIIVRNEKAKLEGVIDESGHWLIKPQEIDLWYCSDGVFAFKEKKGKLWGFIDGSGKIICPPQYDAPLMKDFHFTAGLIPVLRQINGHNEVQILDQNCKVIWRSSDYDNIFSSNKKLIAVRHAQSGKVGAIGWDGKIKIPPTFASLTLGEGNLIVASDSGKSFLVDFQGKAISPEFSYHSLPVKDVLPVYVKTEIGTLLQFLTGDNPNNNVPLDCYRLALWDINQGKLNNTNVGIRYYLCDGELIISRSEFLLGSLWELIDKKGQVLFSSPFVKQLEFGGDGFVLFNSNAWTIGDTDHTQDRWGYMDTQGKVVIAPKYRDARKFERGFAAVSSGTKIIASRN